MISPTVRIIFEVKWDRKNPAGSGPQAGLTCPSFSKKTPICFLQKQRNGICSARVWFFGPKVNPRPKKETYQELIDLQQHHGDVPGLHPFHQNPSESLWNCQFWRRIAASTLQDRSFAHVAQVGRRRVQFAQDNMRERYWDAERLHEILNRSKDIKWATVYNILWSISHMLLNAHARILAHDLPAFSTSKPLGPLFFLLLCPKWIHCLFNDWFYDIYGCLLSLSDVHNPLYAAQRVEHAHSL